MRASWGPSSLRTPSPKTQILDACLIVDRRCAMTIVVHLVVARSASRASWTTRSDLASSADVASSSTRHRGSRTSARAMATRCFWPPESWTPRAPTAVRKPSGNVPTKSNAFASFAARSTSSSVAAGLP
mmetsp:Transcript_18840/g.61750  ORF Transcript_18840/g.61750 Transcript_18840/m.61750 type:complete len:129 (-) Transcript_18840:1586-1972(-)